MAENNFEKLLGKNGELVEERKKQVLEGAFGIVQRYYEETPNKMEAVAKLFNKKINEPFEIESNIHKAKKWVRFSDDGMQYYDSICQRWYPTDGFLKELLTGQAVIVNG